MGASVRGSVRSGWLTYNAEFEVLDYILLLTECSQHYNVNLFQGLICFYDF